MPSAIAVKLCTNKILQLWMEIPANESIMAVKRWLLMCCILLQTTSHWFVVMFSNSSKCGWQPGRVCGREHEATLAERFETRVVWTVVARPASYQVDTANIAALSSSFSLLLQFSTFSKKVKVAHTLLQSAGVTELIPVLRNQPAGDVSHKPGGRLPLLSARPAVTLATLKRAATNFAAWWTQAQWV